MDEYALDIRPGEVLQWLQEDARRKHPSLLATASKEYRAESDFDREAAGIGADEDVALVTAMAVLEVTPLGKQRGWRLQLRAQDSIGLKPVTEDEGYEDEAELSVDAFVTQFLLPEKGEIEVILYAEDAEARRRFESWLARRRTAEKARA